MSTTEDVDPAHYKRDPGGVECIDALRSMLGKDAFVAYCRGQVIRYLWRLGKKDDPQVEAAKAMRYLEWIADTLNDKTPRRD